MLCYLILNHRHFRWIKWTLKFNFQTLWHTSYRSIFKYDCKISIIHCDGLLIKRLKHDSSFVCSSHFIALASKSILILEPNRPKIAFFIHIWIFSNIWNDITCFSSRIVKYYPVWLSCNPINNSTIREYSMLKDKKKFFFSGKLLNVFLMLIFKIKCSMLSVYFFFSFTDSTDNIYLNN